jgi:hypothetical protein
MSASTLSPSEPADLIREGWQLLVEHLGLSKALEFVVLLERGKGNSVAEIEKYWADASIDEIHARILQWKKA